MIEPPASSGGARLDMQRILPGCVENLRSVHRASDGLFPFSSRLTAAGIVNDYRLRESRRYTVNTLLGLQTAALAGVAGVSVTEVEAMIETFVRHHVAELSNHADLGLLVLLLTGRADGDEQAGAAVDRLHGSLSKTAPADIDMQDLGWTIWGAAVAARRDIRGAEALGRSALALVKEHFVDSRSSLPRHSPRRYRSNVVSFGSLVYFLRAMHEAADAFDDPEAAALFHSGVERALALQGPRGEWPWMIDTQTGRAFDVYPVFSVHQDSMAMLFLHPAADRGVPGVSEAIERSVAWVFGDNELGVRFYLEQPFFAYRSIERSDRLPRLRRYLRSLGYRIAAREGTFGRARVRVNEECRSYHLGWILHVWSRPAAGPVPAG